MRKITTAAVLLAIALLAAPAPSFSQACLHRGGESPAERQRRADALTAVRFIDSAQSSARRAGGYRQLSELSAFLAPHRSDGGRLGEVARQMRFDVDEVLPGWDARLVVSADGYMLMMRDTTDPCGYGLASSDEGIVLEGHRVGPSPTLRTN